MGGCSLNDLGGLHGLDGRPRQQQRSMHAPGGIQQRCILAAADGVPLRVKPEVDVVRSDLRVQ